jgi:hypothetical protein
MGSREIDEHPETLSAAAADVDLETSTAAADRSLAKLSAAADAK